MVTRTRCLTALLVAAFSSTPALAQNDLAAPYEGPVAVAPTEPVPLPVQQGFELLHDNGPIVNSPGTGVGGADESVLQNVSLGMSTLGFDHSVSSGWRVADDFVSLPIDWHIQEIVTYAYQMGAGPGTSTMSTLNYCIWDGEPGNGGGVVLGDCATDSLSVSVDTGILRVTEQTSGSDSTRAIMENRAFVNYDFHFWPRTYWLDWQVSGTLASGPYTPPVTITGTCETGNALQSFDGGVTWEPAVDEATGCRQGFPFQLYGHTIIPVELTSFQVIADGDDARLTWETASETNNAGFEVQVQKDANSWNAIGFVQGHGTTTEAQTYSFTAGGLDPGSYSFRLKQIDFDGAFEYFYSPITEAVEVTIEVAGTHALSRAYPNPFNPRATFAFTAAQGQHVTATLYNALGQRVAVLFDGFVEANAQQTVQIDGAGLASGLYVVRVQGERFADALRVTLLK